VAVASPYGVISDNDFTRWQSWLQDTGSVTGPLNPTKFYTDEFNQHPPKSGGK